MATVTFRWDNTTYTSSNNLPNTYTDNYYRTYKYSTAFTSPLPVRYIVNIKYNQTTTINFTSQYANSTGTMDTYNVWDNQPVYTTTHIIG